MEIFLNWLFGYWDRLTNILEIIYYTLDQWGHWWPERGRYILIEWWERISNVFSTWYDRVYTIVHGSWERTNNLLFTWYDGIYQMAYYGLQKLNWFLQTGWGILQKFTADWLDKLWWYMDFGWLALNYFVNRMYVIIGDLLVSYWDKLLSVIRDWYEQIRTIAFLWYEKIKTLALDWYIDILYLIQNLPSAKQVLTDWFPWLTWLFSKDIRTLLFHFLEHPGETIWLYIVDVVEDGLDRMFDAYW